MSPFRFECFFTRRTCKMSFGFNALSCKLCIWRSKYVCGACTHVPCKQKWKYGPYFSQTGGKHVHANHIYRFAQDKLMCTQDGAECPNYFWPCNIGRCWQCKNIKGGMSRRGVVFFVLFFSFSVPLKGAIRKPRRHPPSALWPWQDESLACSCQVRLCLEPCSGRSASEPASCSLSFLNWDARHTCATTPLLCNRRAKSKHLTRSNCSFLPNDSNLFMDSPWELVLECGPTAKWK